MRREIARRIREFIKGLREEARRRKLLAEGRPQPVNRFPGTSQELDQALQPIVQLLEDPDLNPKTRREVEKALTSKFGARIKELLSGGQGVTRANVGDMYELYGEQSLSEADRVLFGSSGTEGGEYQKVEELIRQLEDIIQKLERHTHGLGDLMGWWRRSR